MPQVPRYGPTRVSTNPLPGVRGTAAETSTSTGADLSQQQSREHLQRVASIGTLGRVGAAVVTQIAEEYRKRANDTKELEYENQLATWETQRLYGDGQTPGALALQGKAAMGATEASLADYDKFAGEIAATLSNDEQRARFEQSRLRRRASLELTLRQHTFGEMKQYEGGELQSYVKNHVGLAISKADTPMEAELEMQAAVAKVQQHGPGLGMGAEQIDEQVAAIKASVYVGVTRSLMAGDKLQQAKDYFAVHGDEIRGAAHQELKEQLNAQVDQARVFGVVEKVMGLADPKLTTKLSELEDALTKTVGADDPHLKDMLSLLGHQYSLKKAELTDTRHQQGIDALNKIDALVKPMLSARMSGDALAKAERSIMDTLMASPLWANSDEGERQNQRVYVRTLLSGREVTAQTGLVEFQRLMDLATSEDVKEREDFLAQTARLDRRTGAMSMEQINHLSSVRVQLRAAKYATVVKENQSTMTSKEIVTEAMRANGLDTSPPEGSEAARYVADLRLRVEGQINKNTPPEDIRKVIATEIQQQVMVPGGANPLTRFLWPDSTMPAYQVTYTSVPAGLREPIRQALQGKGLMSDDAAVANIYREVFNTNNLAIIDAAIKKAGLPVTDANRLRVYFLEREKKK